MPTQFSIAFAASTNSIRIYLGLRLSLGTWRRNRSFRCKENAEGPYTDGAWTDEGLQVASATGRYQMVVISEDISSTSG